MKRKYIIFSILTLILALGLVGCGSSTGNTDEAGSTPNLAEAEGEVEQRVFRIAHSGGQSHINYPTMTIFKEELEKRSNGRLSAELFSDGILGTDPEVMTQLAAGTIDIAVIIVGELANRSSSFNAWFMPFLLEDQYAAYEMAQTEEAQALFDTLGEDVGVHPLGYLFIEMRDIVSKTPITDISQIAGTNIRVTPSPAIIDLWSTLGANPTPVEFAEVYSAFQTGVIDTIDSGLISVLVSRLHEVGKHVTKLNHTAFASSGLMSQKVWDELSDEDKRIIEESFEVARERNIEIYAEDEEEAMKEFLESGGTVSEIEDKDALMEKIDQFHEKYAVEDEYIKAFIEKAKEISTR